MTPLSAYGQRVWEKAKALQIQKPGQDRPILINFFMKYYVNDRTSSLYVVDGLKYQLYDVVTTDCLRNKANFLNFKTTWVLITSSDFLKDCREISQQQAIAILTLIK